MFYKYYYCRRSCFSYILLYSFGFFLTIHTALIVPVSTPPNLRFSFVFFSYFPRFFLIILGRYKNFIVCLTSFCIKFFFLFCVFHCHLININFDLKNSVFSFHYCFEIFCLLKINVAFTGFLLLFFNMFPFPVFCCFSTAASAALINLLFVMGSTGLVVVVVVFYAVVGILLLKHINLYVYVYVCV